MSHQNQYLESKVTTASPQQLHLMLIEGGIRFGRQARMFLEQGDENAASDSLLRTLDIVGELLAGVRGGESEINQKLAELYLFVFRRVGEAKLSNDIAKLNEALGVLEYERETWQLACEQAEAEQNAEAELKVEKGQTHKVPKPASSAKHAPLTPHTSPNQSSQLSFEA